MGAVDVVRRLYRYLLPRSLPNNTTSETANEPQKRALKLRPTSCLDGLRGIAALIVFFYHIVFSFGSFHDFGYGVDSRNTWIIQLPILRLIFSGHAMVTIFFVVGGYVLSIKPVLLMHSRSWEALFNSFASTCFRRGFRLYIPAFVVTFITMLTIYFGLWEFSRSYITADQKYIFFEDNHVERFPSFWEQIADWAHQSKLMTNVFTYWSNGILMPYYPRYDPHLWTIPVEMRSSLLLMLLLLGLAKCRTLVRLGFMILTILFVGWWDHWELVCFLVGSLLCQIDFLTLPKPSSVLPTNTSTTTKRVSTALTTFTFIMGMYLLSAPPQLMENTPGYMMISSLIPSSYTDAKRFPLTIGAALVVYSLMRSPTLQTPFLSRPAQYLGEISFSLYIVHGPLIHMVGFTLIPSLWVYFIGFGSNMQWITGILFGGAILGVIVLCAASAFYRWIETWSIDVSKAAEVWAFEKEDVTEK